MNAAQAASLVVTVASVFFYHLAQKLTPATVNPALSLLATYAVAIVCSAALFFLFPLEGGVAGLSREVRAVPWPSWALGLTVVGIEGGFLWAYRAGWAMGPVALSANAISASALLLVGLVAFKDSLGARQIAGFVLCLAGLWLLTGGASKSTQ